MNIKGINDPNLQEIHQYIKTQPNPFLDSIVRDVWDNIIDVPEINQEVTESIYKAIKHVQDEKLNQAILVLGEPGSGKTHLLARIQRYADESHKFLFVYIKPIGDITKINQHILRELMISLLKKLKNRNLSPLFQFLTIIIRNSIRELKEYNGILPEFNSLYNAAINTQISIEDFYKIILQRSDNVKEQLFEKIIQYITNDSPQIDASFLRVFFHLFNPKLQSWTQDWLKAVDLSEETLLQLRVKHSLDSEDRAYEALQSIFTLAKGPILLCFDQIESIYDRFREEFGINLLFDRLMNYYNNYKNLVTLIMCNTQYWSEHIESEISKAEKDRINIKEHLSKLSQTEALTLVSKRMEVFWKNYQDNPPPNLTFPFTEQYIYYIAQKSGWNPRRLIQYLNADFESLKKMELLSEFNVPEEVEIELTEELKTGPKIEPIPFDVILQEISSDNANSLINLSAPEFEDGLTGFFTDFFKECQRNKWSLFGWNNLKFTPNIRKSKSQKPITFLLELEKTIQQEGTSETENIAFLTLITNSTNGNSLASFLKRIREYLFHNASWKGILIRNENFKIEGRFPASVKVIKEMENRIKVIYILRDDISTLFALKKMLEKASGGELQKNNYLIKRSEVIQYIYQIIHDKQYLFSKFPGLTDEKKVIIQTIPPKGIIKQERSQRTTLNNNSEIIQKILTILNQKKILNATSLIDELKENIEYIEEICRIMEQDDLITVLSVSTEEGFLIVPKPKKGIL